MHILYGVQTTGHGHLIRSAAMLQALRDLGHTVHTLFSGDPSKEIWNRSHFEPCTRMQGLTFCSRRGRIRYLKTAGQLDLRRFFSDISTFPAGGFDLVVTDYEPISARIARRWGITSLGIGHLYSFEHEVPISGKSLPGSRLIMRRFAPVDVPLGLHWHHFGQPILPPTIPPEVQPAASAQLDKILVYLPFESLSDIAGFLRPFRDHRFFVYCRCQAPHRRGNLELRPFSREGFVKDLGECNGVICNAGFSLVSEALHLGKKVLVKPLAGQIEQSSNAKALQRLALGSVMQALETGAVGKWLQLPQPRPQNYPDVIDPVAKWIDSGDWASPLDLARSLWKVRTGWPFTEGQSLRSSRQRTSKPGLAS